MSPSRGLSGDEMLTTITSRAMDSTITAPTVMGLISGVHSIATSLTNRVSVPELGIDTPHVDDLRLLLNRVNDWGLDTFRIEDLSGQRPLTAITYRIFQERCLLRTYAIEPQTLISYLLTLEDHYQQVPYHNKAHGADVCQSMHVLLNASALDVSERSWSQSGLQQASVSLVVHPCRASSPSWKWCRQYSPQPYTMSIIPVWPISFWSIRVSEKKKLFSQPCIKSSCAPLDIFKLKAI